MIILKYMLIYFDSRSMDLNTADFKNNFRIFLFS